MNATADPDAPLVERLAGGDLDALGGIYLRHGGAVRTLLARVLPDLPGQDADEICQETFLTLPSTLGRYRHRGQLRSWLYGIALRVGRAHRRKAWWREAILRTVGFVGSGGGGDDPEARTDAARRVEAALRALPEPQREVVVLTAVEGLSVAEAAAVLGIPENAASTRLYRARRALREDQ